MSIFLEVLKEGLSSLARVTSRITVISLMLMYLCVVVSCFETSLLLVLESIPTGLWSLLWFENDVLLVLLGGHGVGLIWGNNPQNGNLGLFAVSFTHKLVRFVGKKNLEKYRPCLILFRSNWSQILRNVLVSIYLGLCQQ